MRRSATAAVLAAVLLSACGEGAVHHTTLKTASCDGSRFAAGVAPGESAVYRAGPLTLAVGEDLVESAPAPSSRPNGSEAVAILTGSRPVVVRVRSVGRARLALEFAPNGQGQPQSFPADGLEAVRFAPCPHSRGRFAGGVVFAGRGCAELRVLPPGSAPASVLIPIAGSLQGCPARPASHALPAAALPFLGVACGRPDWTGCDRIGVGVRLDRTATLVVASVAGRLVTLSPPPPNGGKLWLGYLDSAGLHHGALRVVTRPRGLWFGTPEVFASVWVRAWLPNGRVASTPRATVLLHPGFG